MYVKNKNRFETGQAIILITFLMIGMIGMIGLAVDGGEMYYLNRDLQNSVDAGVIPGTYSLPNCTNGNVEHAVLAALAQDGITPENSTITISAPYFKDGIRNQYVDVGISQGYQVKFMQVFGYETIPVSADATGVCTQTLIVERALIVGTAPNCPGGDSVKISGANQTFEGAIVSNGDININSSNCNANDILYVGVDQLNGVTANSVSQLDENFELRSMFGTSADYAPGTAFAIEMEAAGLYQVMDNRDPAHSSTINTNQAARVFNGAYYCPDGCKVIGDNWTQGPDGFSFVTPKSFNISATNVVWDGFIVDEEFGRLAVLADGPNGPGGAPSCNYDAITYSGKFSEINGKLVAPNGGIKIANSESVSVGGMYGYTIDIQASNMNYSDYRYADPFKREAGIAE